MISALLVFMMLQATEKPAAKDLYAPLRLYQGKWKVLPEKATTPDILENSCARLGRFFVCEQTVNSKPGGLITFLPAGAPGHYFTSPLTPDAQAIGRGDLTIAGDHWEYSSKDEENGKTTWYRTLNDFSRGGATIRFEVQKSSDGKAWETTMRGEETRMQ